MAFNPMRYRLALLVIAWWLPAALVYARAGDPVAASHPRASSGTPPYLDYSQGRIDAEITAVPLRWVLSKLSAKVGLQTRVSDPRIGDYPVTLTLEAVLLTEAIARLLEGFSYAMYVEGTTLTLSVLSTPPNPRRSPVSAARVISPVASLQGAIPADPRPPGAPAVERETEGPSSLEEFEPITMEEPEPAISSDEGEDTAPSTQQVDDNPAYSEALLQRALNALRSEHKDLHSVAIAQLADLTDPRATKVLIEAALSGAEQTPLRHQAVAALSQHVTTLASADTASVNALKQLAQDSDQEVRKIASQALQAILAAAATGPAR